MKLTLSNTEALNIVRRHLALPSDIDIEIVEIVTDKAATLTPDQLKLLATIDTLLSGPTPNKIAAIKEYRSVTCVGLWEAKMVVESWPSCKATIEKTQKFVTARRSTSNYDKIEFVTIYI